MKRAYVYVISAGEMHQKIGITTNINTRVATLQTAHYHQLTLLHFVENECAAWIEARCHELLKHRRLRGEWFFMTREEAVSVVQKVTRQAVPGVNDPGYTPNLFREGQRIVCIAEHINADDDEPEVTIGEVYTVSFVHENWYLSLEELPTDEVCFCPSRFRPFNEDTSEDLMRLLQVPALGSNKIPEAI